VLLKTLTGHVNSVLAVVFSPKGDQLISTDGTIRFWDVKTGEITNTIYYGDGAYTIALSPQGDVLGISCYDNTVPLCDVETGFSRQVLKGHDALVTGIAFSPKGNLVATEGLDKTVRIWDVASGQSRAVLRNLPGKTCGLDWSRRTDANYIVNGCEDGSVLMWEVVEEARRGPRPVSCPIAMDRLERYTELDKHVDTGRQRTLTRQQAAIQTARGHGRAR
jgi:WD40 repeat protein